MKRHGSAMARMLLALLLGAGLAPGQDVHIGYDEPPDPLTAKAAAMLSSLCEDRDPGDKVLHIDEPLALALLRLARERADDPASALACAFLVRPEPRLVREALTVISNGLLPSQEQLEAVRRHLENPDRTVRATAILCLSAHPDLGSAPSLTAKLADEDLAWKTRQALTKISGGRDFLADIDEWKRWYAEENAAAGDSLVALAQALQAAHDRTSIITAVQQAVLLRSVRVEVVELLKPWADNADPEIAHIITEAITALRQPQGKAISVSLQVRPTNAPSDQGATPTSIYTPITAEDLSPATVAALMPVEVEDTGALTSFLVAIVLGIAGACATFAFAMRYRADIKRGARVITRSVGRKAKQLTDRIKKRITFIK